MSAELHGNKTEQKSGLSRHYREIGIKAVAAATLKESASKSRFRTGAKVCSVAIIMVLLVVAALGPAKWAPRTELGWQFDHFIGYFGITLFVCIAWPRPLLVGGIIMAVAALLESLQALTPDRSANLEAALWGAGGGLAAALVAELFIQRHLVAVLTAVAAALAWQSYGDAAKQIIATKAPELGWSPEAKQMIASWTLGWTKPPASPEKIAPETVEQVQQITQSLGAVRETVQELAGSQRSMARDIARLESAVAEILKIKEPRPQPPAAPRAQAPGGAIVVTGTVEDRACITKAAAQLPKVATIGQSRVVPQSQARGRQEQDPYHVKVEIDASVAGQTSTYIFNCIHSGAVTVIQPLGMR